MNTENNVKTTIHRASSRGGGDHGWLKTSHSFSFADWYESARMGFGALRVLNDDTIAEGTGFGTHSHSNMEIITIPIRGTLAHKDSTGGVGELSAGNVQVMSAGTGVRHSEYNGGKGELELFQIWITPNKHGITPRYEDRMFPEAPGETLVVAPMGHDGALNIHQDAYITRFISEGETSFEYAVKNEGDGVYFFVIDGEANVAGESLSRRDGMGVENLDVIPVTAKSRVDLIAIEVPMK